MSDDFSKDAEWLEALEADPVDSPADPPKDDEKKEEDDDGDNDDDAKDDGDTGKDDDSKGDDSNSADDTKGDDKSDDEADKKDEPPVETTEDDKIKAAVKEALQETEASKVDRTSKVEAYKAEVSKTLYPEGIDRTLRDSDGDPITGIEDLTKLVNPKTGDLFTDEEAGSWLLQAQQKLNQDVQTVERFVEQVAEVNLRIEEGAARVVEKYGKVLTANPDLKDRLLAGYNRTLVKDPKTGVAINDPIDVVEFFDLALEPRIKQEAEEAEAAAKANKEAEERAKKTRQSDRGDLKQSGKADTVPEKDKEWAEAIKDYEEGNVL